jgi:hypothetical protein
MLEGLDGGVADDVPKLAGKSSAKTKAIPETVERSDDAVAQLLQMFHEGHAQHAVLFFVLRISRPAEEAEVAADAG